MLDYALGLLSYWSAVCKIVGFFLKFCFATGRVWREKNVFLAFLLSHILSVFTLTPDLSIDLSRVPF